MDLFRRCGCKYIGPGGLKCPCCDSKLSKKRKSKHRRNLFSKLRRNRLKLLLIKEINEELTKLNKPIIT